MDKSILFDGMLGSDPVRSESFSGKSLVYARSDLLPGGYFEYGQYLEVSCRLCICLSDWLIVPGIDSIDTKEVIVIPPLLRDFELAFWLFPSWSCHFQIIGVSCDNC
jgi:hypothetical protein